MQNEIVDSRSFYEIFLASAIRTCFPKLIHCILMALTRFWQNVFLHWRKNQDIHNPTPFPLQKKLNSV